jgi:sec-independent protein translocase protein TatC
VFYRYYVELKSRAWLLLVASFSIILVSYSFKEILLSIVVNSYKVSFISKLSYFIFTDVVEIFNVYICLIFFIVKQIIVFYLVYHVLILIAPGLTKLEYRFFITLLRTSIFLFMLSVILFKKIIFPFSWDFFLSFKDFVIFRSLTLHFEAKLMDYVTFFCTMYFSCVFYFQFFLFPIFFFTYLGEKLRVSKFFRKLLYFSCILFSTLVTPPDVTSQVVLSLTLIVGCEVLIYCSLFKNVLKELIR